MDNDKKNLIKYPIKYIIQRYYWAKGPFGLAREVRGKNFD